MKKGSVSVKVGNNVKAGDVVGIMGLSGHTTFPHIHLTLRKGKTVIDPISGLKQGAACAVASSKPMGIALPIEPQKHGANGALLDAGFSSKPVTREQLLARTMAKPAKDGPILLYAQAMNVRKGDVIQFLANGPDGIVFENSSKPWPRDQAAAVAYSGVKRPFVSGVTYIGTVELVRDDVLVDRRVFSIVSP